MNIEINPIDFLSATHKRELGKIIFEQLKKSIEGGKYTKIEVDINKHINNNLDELLGEDFYLGNHYDVDKIGNLIGKFLFKSTKAQLENKVTKK